MNYQSYEMVVYSPENKLRIIYHQLPYLHFGLRPCLPSLVHSHCWICIISICHNITFRINIPEHTTNYISFTLLILITYHSPILTCDLICTICRIIIIHVNCCIR